MSNSVRVQPTPDIQALIEEANSKLSQVRVMSRQSGKVALRSDLDLIARLAAALSALSGETETEWEYGAKIFISGKVDGIANKPEDVTLGRSKSWRADSEWVNDSLVRRRKAGPWIEVTK